MRTVKWNPFLSGVCAALGAMLLIAGVARADVTSDHPAAILVFPKVVLDASATTDTLIQLTNTAANPVNVRCFYINANGHCSNDPTLVCNPDAEVTAMTCPGVIPGVCLRSWQETDFAFRLTSKQPIDWTLGSGLSTLPLSDSPGPTGDFSSGSIPPAPEDPFRGELKCIEVDENENPTDLNDLKGEASIEVFGGPAGVDVRGYNAIGIQAIKGNNDGDNTLCLGGSTSALCPGGAEYNACPAVLIVDHFFDDADDPTPGADTTVRSDLTLVPCSEDLNLQVPATVVAQFLVFNEFEQRFSTSTSVTCFRELALSDIATRAGASDDFTSIFNVNVSGTLTGQTTVRGVADNNPTTGRGLLAVLEEFHGRGTGVEFVPEFSAAVNVHQRGIRTQADIIQLPSVQTGSTGQ